MEGLVLAGVLISHISFIVASCLLYRLTVEISEGNRRLAYWAALSFIWQPCMMFMSAVYSESLFAALSFAGMLQWERANSADNSKSSGSIYRWKAAFWFALASTVRSNGMLYGGFFIYSQVVRCINYFGRNSADHSRKPSNNAIPVLPQLLSRAWLVEGGETVGLVTLSAAGMLAFQWFGYRRFCTTNPAVITVKRPWCETRFPQFIYSFVQEHYW